MLKMVMPVRRERATYRSQLAAFQEGPGPYLSLYLDVRPGEARRGVRLRLLSALEDLVTNEEHNVTPEQWAAAGETVPLIEDVDASLVAFIDARGASLVTGYPELACPETVLVSDRPILGPMLAAEQALIHHVVAVIGDESLLLRTTPRHGDASSIELGLGDEAAVSAVIQRAARVSSTALIVLCAPGHRLGPIATSVLAGVPATMRLAEVDTDSRSPEEILAEIDRCLAETVEAKNDEVLSLWPFHSAHDETVDGLDAATRAVSDGRVGLLLVDRDATIDGPHPSTPAAAVEALTADALAQGRPVHVVEGPRVELEDGVGVILANRVEPDQIADLLER